jgi:predicted metalloprotease
MPRLNRPRVIKRGVTKHEDRLPAHVHPSAGEIRIKRCEKLVLRADERTAVGCTRRVTRKRKKRKTAD